MDQYTLNDIIEYMKPDECIEMIKNIEILKYIKKSIRIEIYEKYGWNENICLKIIHDGNLKYLKYAHKNGLCWDENTCAFAAFYGHLECLKYAHENGCPWDEWTCYYAKRNKQYECLKYAYENGCIYLFGYEMHKKIKNENIKRYMKNNLYERYLTEKK